MYSLLEGYIKRLRTTLTVSERELLFRIIACYEELIRRKEKKDEN